MAALISGKDNSSIIRQALKKEVDEIRLSKDKGFCPGLTIVQVGDRNDSNTYIRQKLKAAEEIGIVAKHMKLPRYFLEGIGRKTRH